MLWGKDLYYLFNFTQKEVNIDLLGTYKDCVSQKTVNQVTMSANGFAVIVEEYKK